jgi:hypothetical protein
MQHKHADFAFMNEGMALHKFKKMRFDVSAGDAVGLDHGARLGINVIPRPAQLRAQPAS